MTENPVPTMVIREGERIERPKVSYKYSIFEPLEDIKKMTKEINIQRPIQIDPTFLNLEMYDPFIEIENPKQLLDRYKEDGICKAYSK
mmetsp:Transcript_19944/g.9281  ORF Transcript_19944/g.9281 Transcript_19944/m.9281 type:complete len:88 (-) Transcript_19944:327-590(-)